jgi:hypothetical protein
MATTQPNTNRIKIANPPLENEIRTYLVQDSATSATVLYTIDNSGFLQDGTVDYYIIVGDMALKKAKFY